MKLCQKCQKEMRSWLKIDGKWSNLTNRKFCFMCSPFKAHNTKNLTKAETTASKVLSSYEHVKKFRHKKKNKAILYKGGKCTICGYDKCNRNLAFHHIDPNMKDFNISAKGSWGFERIKAELDKCILVCHNCHGEIHEGLVVVEELESSA